MHDDGVLRDHDFHPDESSVRIFCTPDRVVDEEGAEGGAYFDSTTRSS
jgi:hypothetical protein